MTPFEAPLLVEALSVSELAGDETWWTIYAQSFPSREREPRDVIVRSLERRVGIALRARRNATTVGLATAHLLKSIPAVFLVYVATTPEARGAGVGRALVEQAWQLGAGQLRSTDLEPMGLIWEIEDPDAHVDAGERARRQDRLRFFQRLGAELLTTPYTQPPVDGVAPVSMRLMYRPASGSPLPSALIVDALVRAIYFEKYRDLNEIPVHVLLNLLNSNDRPAKNI